MWALGLNRLPSQYLSSRSSITVAIAAWTLWLQICLPYRLPRAYDTETFSGNFDRIPDFVYGVLVGYFIFFNAFPVNMYLQYAKVKQLRHAPAPRAVAKRALERIWKEEPISFSLRLRTWLPLCAQRHTVDPTRLLVSPRRSAPQRLSRLSHAHCARRWQVGKWADYRYGERVYVVLSLLAKSLLAWLVFGGTMQPDGDDNA